jgi:hypothetical protein
MNYNYCTLFDSLYLSRALAMYDSLKSNTSNFHLYIFPFDDRSEQILKELSLENVTIISLNEFEDERLLGIKNSRTKGEYCWTCTPATIHYCISKFNLDHCTYIDADLFFFSNPNILVDEMKDKSVLITEHRYSKEYNRSLKAGIYCVQFITFKNTTDGLTVLNWWLDRCLEWCYSRYEDGKFGDQKYLDDWTTRFTGVHVLKHLGGGVAPWNIQQYTFSIKDDKIQVHFGEQRTELIFYHFHYVKFYSDKRVDLGNFKLTEEVKTMIYRKYFLKLEEMETMLKQKFNFDRIFQKYFYKTKFLNPLHKTVRMLLGVYNVENISDIKNGKIN